MLEYGQAVGQASGATGSGSGRSVDLGGDITHLVSDAVSRISTLPPVALVLLAAVVVLAGLFVLKRL
jgi:hypothetical protein